MEGICIYEVRVMPFTHALDEAAVLWEILCSMEVKNADSSVILSTHILIAFKGKYGIWGGNQQYVYPGWHRHGDNDTFLGLRSGISPSTMPRLVSLVFGTSVGLIRA